MRRWNAACQQAENGKKINGKKIRDWQRCEGASCRSLSDQVYLCSDPLGGSSWSSWCGGVQTEVIQREGVIFLPQIFLPNWPADGAPVD
jgi:hypothetical protein